MAKAGKPIKQHYLPEFYLKGFTENCNEDDSLYVIEQKAGKQYKARPKKLAIQKHIYTLETNDEDVKYKIEEILGVVESGIGRIIPQIIESDEMPDGKDFNLLMEFIAIMESRVPRGINRTTQWYDQITRLIGKMASSNKDRFEAQIYQMKKEGIEIEDISFEEYKEFVESDEYDIQVDQNTLMKHFLDAVNAIHPTLCDRTWSICKVETQNNYFVCSDYPVFLGWTRLPEAKWMQHSPGHSLKDTLVLFPLNKSYAICGFFDGEAEVINCSTERVALINSQVSCRANAIYSCRPDFIWRDSNGQICNVEDLKRRINENYDRGK